MTATAIIGAQHGSEGKGVIAALLAGRFQAAVRVGGPNAGHSLWHEGRVWKMRGVPCAWVNPECQLYIGAGAVVDLDLLTKELALLPDDLRLTIDPQAVVVNHNMQAAEHAVGLRERIGSTTEGVGVARITKIDRDEAAEPLIHHHFTRAFNMNEHKQPPWGQIDVRRVAPDLERHLDDGDEVMLEGTQGSALSLHHGDWPYTTSADTNAAQMLADTGIAPRHLKHVYLVARTFPIRVAGNSGPMRHEITWDALPVDKPERTTVTNNVRRVGRWDPELLQRAAMLNGPCGVFLTFVDYLAPQWRGHGDYIDLMRVDAVNDLVAEVERIAQAPVLGMGTGPDDSGAWHVAEASPRCSHAEHWRG